MSKVKFRDIRMSPKNLLRLESVNDIITEYQADNYILTLRQLYYQLVSRDTIPNDDREYKKLSGLLKEGRMSGFVDWGAIEDRLRKPSTPSSFDSPADIIDACINQYALPRMEGQPNYIEVWVEKDALSGVLKRVTEKYHIPIMVNRGYSSASAMYDSFMRFVYRGAYENRPVKILYLGDFDPSGLDMIRDIEDRTREFIDGYNDGDAVANMQFTVEPIALTMEQIKEHKPPPNPAKVTDPRHKDYQKLYGRTSWEVDALNPRILNELLNDSILENIDENLFESVVAKEQADKDKLKNLKTYL